MAGIKNYSTTAASNASVGSVNFAEGQLPSTVNDSARQLMADIRSDYENREWRDWGHTVTYTSATTFTIPTDVTAIYTANRPIRCTDTTTLYGYVSSTSYDGTTKTTITVTLDSGSLSASLSAVSVGWDPTTLHIPGEAIRGTIASTVSVTGTWSTGDVKLTLKTSADSGWVMCDDGTIGDASSSATTRANADTSALFALLWNNVSDTYAAVSGGRGASASADFSAHKTIALTKMLGRALALSGSGSGLTARSLGQTTGEETHVLSAAEMPSHTHTYREYSTGGEGVQGTGVAADPSRGYTDGVATGSSGSGSAHNNMQPTSFLNAMIKL